MNALVTLIVNGLVFGFVGLVTVYPAAALLVRMLTDMV
jgi:uncharacterized membrane protein YhaH (DUF805 family)